MRSSRNFIGEAEGAFLERVEPRSKKLQEVPDMPVSEERHEPELQGAPGAFVAGSLFASTGHLSG